MPQSGFHALFGVAAARLTRPRQPLWMAGMVVGSLIPDADIIVAGVMRVSGLNGDSLHRTATHSLFLVAGLLIAALLVDRRSRAGAIVLAGLGIGIFGHVVLDIFFWFSGVSLLWPLRSDDGWLGVNLWSWLTLPAVAGNPDLIGNALGALEAGALGLFFLYLHRRIERAQPASRSSRLVWWLMIISFGLFPPLIVTGVLLSREQQEFLVYGAWILLLFPAAVIFAVRYRHALAG